MLPNIHADTVTTIPSGTPATATTLAGWSRYTEYGTPTDPTQTAAVGTSAGYGWLGAKERSTAAETAGLALMGVRFYNRVTGAFTSLDTIPGGNQTAYTYPADAINYSDLDGRQYCVKVKCASADDGGKPGGKGKNYYNFGKKSKSRANKIFKASKASGVYVIHYSNGKVYAGKGTDTCRRIGEHQNKGRLEREGPVTSITYIVCKLGRG